MKQMIPESVVEQLDEAWDDESGFLGRLRFGTFDESAGERYIELLQGLPEISDDFNPRVVTLIWFAPQFIEWQCDRVAKSDSERSKIQRIATGVHEAVSEVLGIP
jgi:hypothetical protein